MTTGELLSSLSSVSNDSALSHLQNVVGTGTSGATLETKVNIGIQALSVSPISIAQVGVKLDYATIAVSTENISVGIDSSHKLIKVKVK